MGAIARFLIALERLARRQGLKIEDAYKFAKQEFGEITPLLRKQIQNVFEKIKKPVVGKPGKKEGAVIPMVKEGAKKAEGIETLDDKGLTDSPLDDLKRIIEESGGTAKTRDEVLRDEMLKDTDPPKLDSRENIMGAIDKLKNPRRPGGPLDPVMGVTRTLARRVLEKRNIEIGKKDPIDVFIDTFGESVTDLKNLGEEIVEAEQIGRNLKPVDDLLEIEGFFDMEIPKNPDKGIPTEDVVEMLEKDLKEKEILEDFDPTDRDPNAKGGLTRTSYALGKGPVLPSDEDPINPFQPKPTGPVLPDKMASYGYDDAMGETFAEFQRLKKLGEIPADMEFDEYLDLLDIDIPYSKKQKQAPSIKLASGFESFKDFIESTGDGELMELYSEFLETGDDARMMLRLKKLGYDMRDDIATGGLAGIINL